MDVNEIEIKDKNEFEINNQGLVGLRDSVKKAVLQKDVNLTSDSNGKA